MKPSTATVGARQQSTCPYCHEEFKSKNKLKKHIGDKHKEEHAAAQTAAQAATQTAAQPANQAANKKNTKLPTQATEKAPRPCFWCGSKPDSKQELTDHVNQTHQGRIHILDKFTPNEFTHSSMETKELCRILRSALKDVVCSLLYCDFRKNFKFWTIEHFEAADRKLLRQLRLQLHYRGIYTGQGPDLEALNALNQIRSDHRGWPDPPAWPERQTNKKSSTPTNKKHATQTANFSGGGGGGGFGGFAAFNSIAPASPAHLDQEEDDDYYISGGDEDYEDEEDYDSGEDEDDDPDDDQEDYPDDDCWPDDGGFCSDGYASDY